VGAPKNVSGATRISGSEQGDNQQSNRDCSQRPRYCSKRSFILRASSDLNQRLLLYFIVHKKTLFYHLDFHTFLVWSNPSESVPMRALVCGICEPLEEVCNTVLCRKWTYFAWQCALSALVARSYRPRHRVVPNMENEGIAALKDSIENKTRVLPLFCGITPTTHGIEVIRWAHPFHSADAIAFLIANLFSRNPYGYHHITSHHIDKTCNKREFMQRSSHE